MLKILSTGYPYIYLLKYFISPSFPCPQFQEAKSRTEKNEGSDELED
ncbi:hypothetical protein SLEP1_g23457 [Rubroshorea leprosula]|uniref:Uncharacterized protein n=1 Tax=Rubroshorea leprosula TaxID=152421 RepID=A0AAV5JCL4_9ROSI|nr:hypothetical protein SLEP1_g23457 [Rubroshorea leprosula]